MCGASGRSRRCLEAELSGKPQTALLGPGSTSLRRFPARQPMGTLTGCPPGHTWIRVGMSHSQEDTDSAQQRSGRRAHGCGPAGTRGDSVDTRDPPGEGPWGSPNSPQPRSAGCWGLGGRQASGFWDQRTRSGSERPADTAEGVGTRDKTVGNLCERRAGGDMGRGQEQGRMLGGPRLRAPRWGPGGRWWHLGGGTEDTCGLAD